MRNRAVDRLTSSPRPCLMRSRHGRILKKNRVPQWRVRGSSGSSPRVIQAHQAKSHTITNSPLRVRRVWTNSPARRHDPAFFRREVLSCAHFRSWPAVSRPHSWRPLDPWSETISPCWQSASRCSNWSRYRVRWREMYLPRPEGRGRDQDEKEGRHATTPDGGLARESAHGGGGGSSLIDTGPASPVSRSSTSRIITCYPDQGVRDGPAGAVK